ncbi:MAG: DUF2764 family protein [Kiritimatiellae bacterium]|nr:DUF2764 family protein [Kiritimatiellia bacterium]
MTQRYYYLVASLPPLTMGDAPPFSAEDFQFRCATVMDEADSRELKLALAGRADEGASSFSREWQQAETQLRNAVATIRAGRLGVESRPYLRQHEGFSVLIEESVTDAYDKPDPLGREMELDRLRWQIADDLAREDPFGLDPVLAFAVKLRIAARWAGMTDEAGRNKVDELIEQSLKDELSVS